MHIITFLQLSHSFNHFFLPRLDRIPSVWDNIWAAHLPNWQIFEFLKIKLNYISWIFKNCIVKALTLNCLYLKWISLFLCCGVNRFQPMSGSFYRIHKFKRDYITSSCVELVLWTGTWKLKQQSSLPLDEYIVSRYPSPAYL